VKAVDSCDLWRDADVSPRDRNYHYNRNAETHLQGRRGGGGDELIAESFFEAGRLSEFPNGPIVRVLGFFHVEPPDGIAVRRSSLSYRFGLYRKSVRAG